MKHLMKHLRPYGLQAVLAPLFKLFEAALELLVPLIMADVIDVGIAQGDTSYILRRCLLLAAFGLGGFACSVVAQYFAAAAATGASAGLRQALFGHIQTLSYQELDTLGASTLITRMTSDMNQVQTGLNLSLRLLLRSPIVVFGAMAMAFTIDTRAALIFAVVIPVLFVIVFAVMLTTVPLYRRVQAKLDRVTDAARENLSGVRVIRAFSQEAREEADFRGRTQALFDAQRFVGRLSALLNPITYAVINLAIVAILKTGAVRVDSGAITQGQLIALYNYMSQILVELIKFASLILSITKALACASRIGQLLELPSGMADGTLPLPQAQDAPAVELQDVSFRYRGGGANVLSGITAAIPHGQTVGIIGGTGSGKTSLVNLIARFYDVTEGCVRVNGADVRALTLESLRGAIGIVPQHAQLFRGTIRENLLWGRPDANDAQLWQALDCAQARSIVEEKPGMLDAAVESGGRNFSGGQRQRLTIARALVRRPPILILDDSASALDFATDAALRRALQNLPWQPTVFIISQRIASIAHADRILVLDDGRLAGSGTHRELLDSCAVYREIWGSQFKKEDAQ